LHLAHTCPGRRCRGVQVSILEECGVSVVSTSLFHSVLTSTEPVKFVAKWA
jgi:hypothetical protein